MRVVFLSGEDRPLLETEDLVLCGTNFVCLGRTRGRPSEVCLVDKLGVGLEEEGMCDGSFSELGMACIHFPFAS